MAAVLSKRKMTEEDIKLQFITPAITKKWALSLITMETRITDGQINLRGNMVSRKEAKKADYILYLNESTPIAIVEAKDKQACCRRWAAAGNAIRHNDGHSICLQF